MSRRAFSRPWPAAVNFGLGRRLRGAWRRPFPKACAACDHSEVADSDGRRHRRELRASYDDRDRAVDFLKRNGAEGRLTTEELTDRVAMALDAKTLGQLDDLVADLPPEPAPPPPVPLLPPPRRSPVDRRLRVGLAALFFLALAAPGHHQGALVAVWIVLLLVASGISRVQRRVRHQEQPRLGAGRPSGPWSSAVGWRPPRAGEKR